MTKMSVLIGVLLVVLPLVWLKTYIFPSHKAPWITDIPIAHRGYFDNDHNIPENTLLAFNRALEKGYAIELDVMLSKDGQVVVHHDHDLKRLCGVDKRIEDLTLAQIQSYKLLKSNEVAPTLNQVLTLVGGRVPIYIEIKHEDYAPAGALEENVAALLKDYKGPIAILSFNPKSLEWFAKHAPEYYRGQNYQPHPDVAHSKLGILVSAFKEAWIAKAHFMVYSFEHTPKGLLPFLALVRNIIPYTIKSQKDYESAVLHASNVIFEKLKL